MADNTLKAVLATNVVVLIIVIVLFGILLYFVIKAYNFAQSAKEFALSSVKINSDSLKNGFTDALCGSALKNFLTICKSDDEPEETTQDSDDDDGF